MLGLATGFCINAKTKLDELKKKLRDLPTGYKMKQCGNLSIDDDSGTNGNKGGHCVKAEGDAKKGPTHLK